MRKELLILEIFLLIIIFFPNQILAHPGMTDSDEGHTCRTNCEKYGLGYGEYHYHIGEHPVNKVGPPSENIIDNSHSFMDKVGPYLVGIILCFVLLMFIYGSVIEKKEKEERKAQNNLIEKQRIQFMDQINLTKADYHISFLSVEETALLKKPLNTYSLRKLKKEYKVFKNFIDFIDNYKQMNFITLIAFHHKNNKLGAISFGLIKHKKLSNCINEIDQICTGFYIVFDNDKSLPDYKMLITKVKMSGTSRYKYVIDYTEPKQNKGSS